MRNPGLLLLSAAFSILLAPRFALAEDEGVAPPPPPVAPSPALPPPAAPTAPPPAKGPSPPNAVPSKPAFQLYPEFDTPVLGLAAVFSLARLVPTTPAQCAPRCDPRDLNPIDRPVAGRWDPRWGTASDVGNIALGASAGLVLVLAEGVLPALNDLVVIAETSLLASAVSGLAAVPARRPRPFLYSDKAPLEERQGGDAALSFVSGHTSSSFAIALSTFVTLHRLYPHSAIPWITLGVGLASASSVGVARVLAGQHFPTDVLAGAVVGSALGVLVPSLHGQKVTIVPQITPTSRGVLFLRAF